MLLHIRTLGHATEYWYLTADVCAMGQGHVGVWVVP